MANNQYVNKVVYGDQTLIDLTNDSVNPGALLEGYTAHMRNGEAINGTIATRAPTYGFNNGQFQVNFQRGLYGGALTFSTIKIPVPSANTNTIIIEVPNGTLTPDTSNADDWIPITIEVDSNGNSNVTDDTIPATGVSF